MILGCAEAAEPTQVTQAPDELPRSADTKPVTYAKPEAAGAAPGPQASDDKASVQLQPGQADSKALPDNPGTETGASAQPAAQSVQHLQPAAEPSQPASGDPCVSLCGSCVGACQLSRQA